MNQEKRHIPAKTKHGVDSVGANQLCDRMRFAMRLQSMNRITDIHLHAASVGAVKRKRKSIERSSTAEKMKRSRPLRPWRPKASKRREMGCGRKCCFVLHFVHAGTESTYRWLELMPTIACRANHEPAPSTPKLQLPGRVLFVMCRLSLNCHMQ